MIIIKKYQLEQFYDRWIGRIGEYDSDTLNNYFDKFFTLFIIYNRIYNVVVIILNERGAIDILKQQKKIKNNKKEPYDNEAATVCVTQFLLDELREVIRQNKCEIEEFKNIIKNEIFNINLYYGQPQREEDLKLLEGLGSEIEFEVMNSLLKIMYNIRCNLFHGEKGHNEDQKLILKPANKCLQNLVELLMAKIRNESE